MSTQKINNAIHNCLEHCYQSRDVVTGIAGFLAKLRASGDWQEAEILEIDAGVRHVLHGIVKKPTDSKPSHPIGN